MVPLLRKLILHPRTLGCRVIFVRMMFWLFNQGQQGQSSCGDGRCTQRGQTLNTQRGWNIQEAEGAKDPVSTCVHQNAHTQHTQYLWSAEYVFSLHSAICNLASNGLANLLLILVHMSTVNMAEPNLYSKWGEFQSIPLSNLHKQQREKLDIHMIKRLLRYKLWSSQESTFFRVLG